MKRVFLVLVSTIIFGTVMAQTSWYIGYENGVKWDNYSYINSNGFYLQQYQLDGVFGGYVGYKLKEYTFETGFYGFYSSAPWIDYDYNTSFVNKTESSHGSSGMDSWVIPIRFGKEFLFCGQKIFIKPEIGFSGIIARNYENIEVGSWGDNVSSLVNPNFIPTSGDSTIAYCYRTSKKNLKRFDFGIESEVSIDYRFKDKADIYFKGSYHSSFNPLYYEIITHYSDTEIVKATNTFNGNSFLLQIGLRYYFAKPDNKI